MRALLFRLLLLISGGMLLAGCVSEPKEYRRGAGLSYLTVKTERQIPVSERYGELEGNLREAVFLYDELVLPSQKIRLQFYTSVIRTDAGTSDTLAVELIGFYRQDGSFREIGNHSERLFRSRPVQLIPAGGDGYFRIAGGEVRLTHTYGPGTAARYIIQAY